MPISRVVGFVDVVGKKRGPDTAGAGVKKVEEEEGLVVSQAKIVNARDISLRSTQRPRISIMRSLLMLISLFKLVIFLLKLLDRFFA